ncbi:anti-sigma factor family protein [Novispirillum sp. DQ9]|uniref:anti-sigma factor family protein n=1 Tax=Novispirillum sp. DQ9 TaxID=3398612 RepID=UPI003C7D28B9
MTTMLDPITNADIDAYVDDQLDVARRIEVEAYLSERPETAAQVMADLRMRDELRLALVVHRGMARPETADAARRLERGLVHGRIFGWVRRAAAIGIFMAAGWMANELVGPMAVTEVVASTPPPAFVEEAIRAHGTTILRASMASQPESSDYDREEIRSATAIVMPALPKDWQVKDVQIFPSHFGPSVEVAVTAGEFGLLSLFAVRPGTFDVVRPTRVVSGGLSSIYFQVGDVAYTVVAKSNAGALDRAADRLADTLF